MKAMKKIVLALLIVSLLAIFTGCSRNDDKTNGNTNNTTNGTDNNGMNDTGNNNDILRSKLVCVSK